MTTRKKSKKNELLIVIPAYNEEKNLGEVLEALRTPEIAEISDVLVVNDASRDATEAVALAHGAMCASFMYNMGYGAGLQLGYKFAVRHGYRYVIQMDADGQHDASNVPLLYHALTDGPESERPDIVLGSRYMEGSAEYRPGWLRSVAYGWFRRIIRCMTGRQVADPTTGLQGLNWRTLKFYSGYLHFDDRYPDANMLAQMLLLGFRVQQIPAVMHYRTDGASMHANLLRAGVYMLRVTLQMLALWVRIRILKTDVDLAQALLETETEEPETEEAAAM